MIHRVLSCYLLFAIAASVCYALPQRFSQQDGFLFPGDADRPEKFPVNPMLTVPPTTISTTTSRPSFPSDRAFNDCLNQCLATSEYNPVCGTDNVVYSNPGRLGCARNCGRSIDIKNYGQCVQNVRG